MYIENEMPKWSSNYFNRNGQYFKYGRAEMGYLCQYLLVHEELGCSLKLIFGVELHIRLLFRWPVADFEPFYPDRDNYLEISTE